MVSQPTDGPLLPKKCPICNRTENLLACGGCKIISYCGAEHQTVHWRIAHKQQCNAVKRAQRHYDAELVALRENAGHWWRIIETRDAMRARHGLVQALLNTNTVKSTEKALEHLMDMFRLCRSDNMGLRDHTPHTMLRLNKLQECYDFVKWWQMADPEGTYDWGDTGLPYLSIKDAEVFEPCTFFDESWPDLAHATDRPPNAPGCHSSHWRESPTEIDDMIRQRAVCPVVASRREIMGCSDQTDNIAKMGAEVLNLYELVNKANKHFWPALLNPGGFLKARSEAYSMVSEQQMQLVLQSSYASWADHPCAIEIIKTLSANS
ncbi:hypothetical protein F5Y16DRAFT_423552 [Xylariaceae sp. FL0255]|nr:hypothetical protein F5Y16DRAFT_423552 [Xylariaceae sp. FL0255]